MKYYDDKGNANPGSQYNGLGNALPDYKVRSLPV